MAMTRAALEGRIRAAIDANGGYDAVRELNRESPGLGWLALWRMASESDDHLFPRALAFCVARATLADTPEPLLEAARLWLLRTWNGMDSSTLSNTLSSMKAFVAEERGEMPSWRSSVLPFLRRCLAHDFDDVRHDAVSFLRVLYASGGASNYLHKAGAVALARDVDALAPADEEERAQLLELGGMLRAPGLPTNVPTSPRALQRLVLDVEDAIDRLSETSAGGLLSAIRYRALLDSAASNASRLSSPVQTIRVGNESAPIRLVESLWRFGESLVKQRHRPTEVELSLLDFGIQAIAAPSASFPVHLVYEADDADRVFDALSKAFGLVLHPDHVEMLEPSVADAALRLIQHGAAANGPIEVVLTKPADADWERILRADFRGIPSAVMGRLARRVRDRERKLRAWVDAGEVPQANTAAVVFQVLDAILERGEVRTKDLENIGTHRQVNYYQQGARILGLLDTDNLPTRRGRALAGLTHDRRMALAAIFFEDSVVGRAWREWSGTPRLVDVAADTAEKFLSECVVGLSGTTVPRRASTLGKWHRELMPFHYAAKGDG